MGDARAAGRRRARPARLSDLGRRARRHRRLRRRLRDAGVRRPLGAGQDRRAVRPLRRRDPAARHPSTTTPTCASSHAAPARLLRDDRDRPRLQRAGAGHHRDLRRPDRRVRRQHPRPTRPARTTSATPRRTARSRSSSPSSRSAASRRTACTRSWCRSATTTAACCPACASRTTAPRSASTASTTAGCGSTACGCRGRTCSTATATSPTTARYSLDIENPDRRFFTMLGTLVQGRVCVVAARHRRQQGRAHDRGALRREAPPVRRARHGDGGARSSTTGCTSAGSAPARPHLRAALRPAGAGRMLHDVRHPRARGEEADEHAPARAGVARRRAPRRSAPGTPRTPSRSAARRAAARATCSANRLGALRADTDVFTTFEGDNHILLQLVAKGLLTDYAHRLRRARPARDGPVRRRPVLDRSRSARACTRSRSGSAVPRPEATTTRSSTAPGRSSCSTTARSTPSTRSCAACAPRGART